MDSAEILRKAIQAARNGRELTARDLFQDVVRLDPNNEVAWMWLSGLLDPLEDRIAACERVLAINPGNQKIRAYLEKLLEEEGQERKRKVNEQEEQVGQVRWFLENGQRTEAMVFLQTILSEGNVPKSAWQLFAELSANVHDKARAYEAILQLDPTDSSARESLKRYRYFQRNPLELALHYEEEGERDKALELYRVLLAEAVNPSEFESIYKNVARLEGAKIENVRHIKPSFTILRLSIGLPVLYILEVFIQEGLNPIRHPAPGLWLGLPMVIFGSFLLTVASVRVRHVIWRRWFGDRSGRGSDLMRAIVSVAGLVLILAPHFGLVLDSYMRMQVFQIPAIPWIQ